MRDLLEKGNFPSDLKNMSIQELNVLCDEIRKVLIHTVSSNGGHLASNLGVVELTVALHKVYSSPNDKFIFDVGHQCYAHKILTGRLEEFKTLRQENGISGFPKPNESIHDAFATGHSSTSISAACGFASAKNIKGESGKVIAIIGDGAFTGGLAYEGLNNAGYPDIYKNLIVILNDNEMAISKNIGGMARYLAAARSKKAYLTMKRTTKNLLSMLPFVGKRLTKKISKSKSNLKGSLYYSTMFEDFGFEYMGPIDGHDLKKCCEVFELIKNHQEKPVFIHINTKKGKGFTSAEINPGAFHGVSKGDLSNTSSTPNGDNFSTVFGEALTEIARTNDKVCAITAAMKHATGLNLFRNEFPNRFFDVGIAEAHAVTFSVGLANSGLVPVFAVYSTFLQRAYDQILHDAAINKAHIVLAIDRAGIVGDDGETHQGLFDVSFLSSIPDTIIYSPFNYHDLRLKLKYGVENSKGIVAVRYPRGSEENITNEIFLSDFVLGYNYEYDYYNLSLNDDILVCTYGREFVNVANAYNRQYSIINLGRVSPIPDNAIDIAMKYKKIYFFEEGIKGGGVGEKFISRLSEKGFKGDFECIAIDNQFVQQSSVTNVFKKFGLDVDGILKKIDIKNRVGKV